MISAFELSGQKPGTCPKAPLDCPGVRSTSVGRKEVTLLSVAQPLPLGQPVSGLPRVVVQVAHCTKEAGPGGETGLKSRLYAQGQGQGHWPGRRNNEAHLCAVWGWVGVRNISGASQSWLHGIKKTKKKQVAGTGFLLAPQPGPAGETELNLSWPCQPSTCQPWQEGQSFLAPSLTGEKQKSPSSQAPGGHGAGLAYVTMGPSHCDLQFIRPGAGMGEKPGSGTH
jgi:hypothetical protein